MYYYHDISTRLEPFNTPEEAYLAYEQGVARMAEFRKKYNSVKNKAKRTEKYLVTMDEEHRRMSEHFIYNNVRLAENKFILINKKLKRFKNEEERQCKKGLKALKNTNGMSPTTIHWYMSGVWRYLEKQRYLLAEWYDMLRIAKGHLQKVDDHMKYARKLRRF